MLRGGKIAKITAKIQSSYTASAKLYYVELFVRNNSIDNKYELKPGEKFRIQVKPYPYEPLLLKRVKIVENNQVAIEKVKGKDNEFKITMPENKKSIVFSITDFNGKKRTASLNLCPSANTDEEPTSTLVESVSLSESNLSLDVGATSKLTATVTPSDATDATVTWTSSDTGIATVDANGTITAVAAGTATITCTATNGTDDTADDKSATCKVTVALKTMTASAEGYSGTYDGKSHGITVTAPEGATVKYGTASGNCDKTASPTYTDAGTYTVYYEVTQTGYTPVTGSAEVKISKAAGTISFATTGTINKTVGDAAFTNTLTLTGDGTVSYTSSKTTVATVDANGQVAIVDAGETTITATVTDGTNYTYATSSVSFTLNVAAPTNVVGPSGGYVAGGDPTAKSRRK